MAGLLVAGNASTKFDAAWIGFSSTLDGKTVPYVNVPVSWAYRVRVDQADTGQAGIDDAACDAFARDVVVALPKLALAARRIVRKASTIRGAAWETLVARRDHAMFTSDVRIAPIPVDQFAG